MIAVRNFCKKKLVRQLPPPDSEANAVSAINVAVTFMYSFGFWIKKQDGIRLARWLMVFLQSYTRCAQISIQDGKHRFGLMPKLHFLHHTAWRLIQECGRADWCINPMSETVQMQEDFIGRPSRVSRRVDVRLLHQRVMDRSLICAQQALEASDFDQRGLLL